MQIISTRVRWDGRDLAALAHEFRKELAKERLRCKGQATVFVIAMDTLHYIHMQAKIQVCYVVLTRQ